MTPPQPTPSPTGPPGAEPRPPLSHPSPRVLALTLGGILGALAFVPVVVALLVVTGP